MSSYNLDTPVTKLSGVGKTRAEQLSRLGICTLRDLIYHFPRAYENRGRINSLSSADLDSPQSFVLTVATSPASVKLKNRLNMTKLRAFDESGSCEIVFFNSPFVKDVFRIGDTFRFYCKPQLSKKGILTLTNPKYEQVIEGVALEDLVPVYPLTEGVTTKLLDKLIRCAIDDVLPSVQDQLPESIRLKLGLCSIGFAIKNLHYPSDISALKAASKRLAFDEMLIFGLGVSISKANRSRAEGVRFSPCSLKPLTDMLPYELTSSQKQAINDVYKDTVLSEDNGRTPAMARIIVGDVGSGKTVCAFAAMYIAHLSGYQSALMVPTEILANQHYEDMVDLLTKLGMRVALLTGSLSHAKKRVIYEGLESGDIDCVVGTHALLSDKVEFNNLGLIVTDEQHRFGVNQRGVLKERAKTAHMLVMSATPIPRSLALALYGDLDISRITELPKGRQRVDTYVVNESYRARLNKFIEAQVKNGGRCYVVCPAIDSEENSGEVIAEGLSEISLINSNELNLKNAVEYTKELRSNLPGVRIECLHGRMKNAEKDEIMRSFSAGEYDVLVSTTVIEVGVNVPSATLMVVENAERFGLSQLHQLRGRVGRGNKKSYCVLVSDLESEKSKARLEVMRTTYDGYETAEKDMLLRGPGDFFSANSNFNLRQSGGFEFKFATSCDDSTLFSSAFETAKDIIGSDPDMSLPEHELLKKEISRLIMKQSNIS